MNKSEKDKILMHSKSSISIPVNSVDSSDQNLSNSHYDDAARTHLSSLYEYIPGIMNPHAKIAHKLNRLFIYSGLVLFSILIGNVQNFLQALGRRSLEMSVRRLDVEQWMSRHLLPEELRRQIRELERYNWGVTRGLNEIMQLDKLPEDLQRDIRRHLFKFVEKFPLFAQMDECIIDAIRERLKQKTYIKGNRILIPGVLIDKMVFIVRGKLESIWEDKDVVELHEGDVCGEELIRLYLKHFVQDKKEERIRIPAHKLLSKRTVRCLTNVQAYTLQAADIEEIISLFSGLLISKPHVHGAIRKESCHMKSHAPNRIKLAWRYRQKRL